MLWVLYDPSGVHTFQMMKFFPVFHAGKIALINVRNIFLKEIEKFGMFLEKLPNIFPFFDQNDFWFMKYTN